MKRNFKLLKIILIINFIFIINIMFVTTNIYSTELNKIEKNILNNNIKNYSYLKAIKNAKEIINDKNNNIVYTDDYLKWLKLSNAEKQKYGDAIPNKEFIKINLPNDKLSDLSKIKNNKKNLMASAGESNEQENISIPNNFLSIGKKEDNKINLKVENQGTSSWCWAYSSLKCLEAYLQKNKNLDYNLAEYHLVYMKLKEFGGWGDYLSEVNSVDYPNSAYKTPGNFEDFLKYIGIYKDYPDIKGPILGYDDENKKYELSDENIANFNSKIPEIKVTKTVNFATISKKYNSNGDVRFFSGQNEIKNNDIIVNFRNEVKKHIINNGAVFSIIDMKMSDYNSDSYSLFTNNPDEIENAHAVTIVGWDDNYETSNFNNGKQPKNKGAWIVLNSWGDSWGNNGLFYISYDDAYVEKYLSGVLEAEKYTETPKIDIKYNTDIKGQVTVIITSNERLKQPDESWKITNEEFYDNTYYRVKTSSTKLEKTFYNNVENKKVVLKDFSNTEVEAFINIKSLADYELGDVNTDGKINIIDLLLIKKYLISNNKDNIFDDKGKEYADLNEDGKINIIDLLLLKRIIIKSK